MSNDTGMAPVRLCGAPCSRPLQDIYNKIMLRCTAVHGIRLRVLDPRVFQSGCFPQCGCKYTDDEITVERIGKFSRGHRLLAGGRCSPEHWGELRHAAGARCASSVDVAAALALPLRCCCWGKGHSDCHVGEACILDNAPMSHAGTGPLQPCKSIRSGT